MKLTPEQRVAFSAALDHVPLSLADQYLSLFLAGCRYQHAVTLELAAKVCEEHRLTQGGVRDQLAEAIRALPYETKDE